MSRILSTVQRVTTDDTSKVISFVRREHILIAWVFYAEWDALQEVSRLRRFLFFLNQVLVNMLLAMLILLWQATNANFAAWYEDDGNHFLVIFVTAIIVFIVGRVVKSLHIVGQSSSGWFGVHPIKKYVVDFINFAVFVTLIALVIYFSKRVNASSGSTSGQNTKTFFVAFLESQALAWALALVFLPLLWTAKAIRCRSCICRSVCRKCHDSDFCMPHYQVKTGDGFVKWRC